MSGRRRSMSDRSTESLRAKSTPPAQDADKKTQPSASSGESPSPMGDFMAPARQFAAMQQKLLEQFTAFWTGAFGAAQTSPEQVADRRFSDEAWSEDPRFDLIRRAYLSYSGFLMNCVERAEVDEKTR